jgi:hypothetical protein
MPHGAGLITGSCRVYTPQRATACPDHSPNVSNGLYAALGMRDRGCIAQLGCETLGAQHATALTRCCSCSGSEQFWCCIMCYDFRCGVLIVAKPCSQPLKGC